MSRKSTADTLYASLLEPIAQFSFDEQVAAVFADMIQRSVPGYTTILGMIRYIAARYVVDNSRCYDLGCSLGAAALAMRQGIRAAGCAIIGVDNSAAMIKRCRSNIEFGKNMGSIKSIPIEFRCCDLESADIEQASMVVLNFTLQFVPLDRRQAIIQKIYNGLLPGGVLVISEKILFEDPSHQQLMTELYHNFKRANGYSDLEIARKRRALEEVLQPETMGAHRKRLRDAGFNSVDAWFQCFTFASLIAIKSDHQK